MRAGVRDWKNPNYDEIYQERSERLRNLRSLNFEQQAKVHDYYAQNPIDWIEDWAHTWDQNRLVGGVVKPLRPFILMDRQKDLIRAYHGVNKDRKNLVVEKTREVGVSWCAVAYGVWMWLYQPGCTVGFGSYSENRVDQLWNSDSLLEKCRIIIRNLPPEMKPLGLNEDEGGHLMKKRLINPQTGAQIIGEVGSKKIGRGAKATMYFVDEYAFLQYCDQVDGSLGSCTQCIVFISTAHGMGSFYQKTQSPMFRQFRFEWRQDPRKSQEWYDEFLETWGPTTTAREVDIDHAASVENVLISGKWVEAARKIRAALKKKGVSVPPRESFRLGVGGLDVGGGKAPSVFIARHGPYVSIPKDWTTLEGDTTITGQKALRYARMARTQRLNFDAPGLGKGVTSALRHSKPEERVLAPLPKPEREVPVRETKKQATEREMYDIFGAIEEDHLVVAPNVKNRELVTAVAINTGSPASDWVRWPDGRTSRETFFNLRAEIGWTARERFKATYETWLWATGKPGGIQHPVEDLIFLPDHEQLCKEMTVLTWYERPGGKIAIERKEDLTARGIPSPDYYDAFVLTLVPARPAFTEQKVGGFF